MDDALSRSRSEKQQYDIPNVHKKATLKTVTKPSLTTNPISKPATNSIQQSIIFIF